MENENVQNDQIIHLDIVPIEIICPSCFHVGKTIILHEATTMWQRIVETIERCCPCKKWNCRDTNHYCCKCGCFIGRVITLDKIQKRTFKLRQKYRRKNSS